MPCKSGWPFAVLGARYGCASAGIAAISKNRGRLINCRTSNEPGIGHTIIFRLDIATDSWSARRGARLVKIQSILLSALLALPAFSQTFTSTSLANPSAPGSLQRARSQAVQNLAKGLVLPMKAWYSVVTDLCG